MHPDKKCDPHSKKSKDKAIVNCRSEKQLPEEPGTTCRSAVFVTHWVMIKNSGNPKVDTIMAQRVRHIKEILRRIPLWRSKCAKL